MTLTQGLQAKIDDDTYLKTHSWQVRTGQSGKKYAVRSYKRRTVWLHRLLAGYPAYFKVSFRNHDSLDLRIDNLLVESFSGAEKHWRSTLGHSEYEGIEWNLKKGLWEPQIKGLSVGLFDNEIDGVRAYNSKMIEIYGEGAKIHEIPFLGWKEMRSFPQKEGKLDLKTSKYRGVHERMSGKYRAELTIEGVKYDGGEFETEIQAAKKYNEMREEHGLM